MFSTFDRKVLERIGFNLMSEEQALTLLGVVFERGKMFFLDILQKEGFPKETGELELRKLLLSVSEESLFNDPHFSLSLNMGALSAVDRAEKTLGRKLNGEEQWAAIKMALNEIFPPTLSEKLFRYLLTNFQPFAELTHEEFGEKLKEHHERQKNLFPKPCAENNAKPLSMGTDTWLVPCPNCSLNKRCDVKTKQFKCKKCGLKKSYDGKSKSFIAEK